MQFAKDSFYMALRSRLAVVNPVRTVTIAGVVRPAVYVAENEPLTAAAPPTECFAISFGGAQIVPEMIGAKRPLIALECEVAYRTAGTSANLNTDRGRTLAALDLELLQICAPPSTAKQDFTQTPAVALGTDVLWQRPQLGAVQESGDELRRVAKTTLFFYPEMDI
jgi:hypothetical protein